MASGVQAEIDCVTGLMGRALGVASAIAAVVDPRGRFLTSSSGIVEPVALVLSHAFLEHVPASPGMLVVADGPHDPRMGRVPAVRDRTVQACVGTRLRARNGRAMGTLLVMDSLPRHWTEAQLAVIATGAALLVYTVDRGAAVTSGVGLRRDLFRAFRQDGSFHPGGGEMTGNRHGLASVPPDSGQAPGHRLRALAP